jgi:hypothetical protein
MNRRDFLKLLGIGAATTAAGIVLPEAIVEPRRRLWQVGRNAPVSGLRYRMAIEGFPGEYAFDNAHELETNLIASNDGRMLFGKSHPPLPAFHFVADAPIGSPVYVLDRNMVDLVPNAENPHPIGTLVEMVSDNTGWIRLGSADPAPGSDENRGATKAWFPERVNDDGARFLFDDGTRFVGDRSAPATPGSDDRDDDWGSVTIGGRRLDDFYREALWAVDPRRDKVGERD